MSRILRPDTNGKILLQMAQRLARLERNRKLVIPKYAGSPANPTEGEVWIDILPAPDPRLVVYIDGVERFTYLVT